jgi:hypothetical protein
MLIIFIKKKRKKEKGKTLLHGMRIPPSPYIYLFTQTVSDVHRSSKNYNYKKIKITTYISALSVMF